MRGERELAKLDGASQRAVGVLNPVRDKNEGTWWGQETTPTRNNAAFVVERVAVIKKGKTSSFTS